METRPFAALPEPPGEILIPAPKPSNEAERLEALRNYGVLDTPPEERFDRVVRLVSRYLGVSTAVISLVDYDRQWFKASTGLDAKETPRDLAFCAHTILEDKTLVVENTLEDCRFADNPLVTGSPSIRFYAGAPLTSPSGHRIGALCALDGVPRQLSAEEEGFMRDMAAIVVDEMELSAAAVVMENYAEALLERNKSLDAFAHTLSHDLAAPIRHIKSFCDLSERDPSAAADCLAHISSSASTADRLLEDLNTFFVADRVTAASDCQPNECLADALKELASEIESSGCEVEVTGALPTLQFYPGLLTTLLRNLIGNAIKYRSDRDLRVNVHGVETEDAWECSVSDNGMGIDEAHQQEVFELLIRLPNEADIPGSGLGLAICKKIVRKSGGEIRMTSKVGEGTCVTFSLPKGQTIHEAAHAA